MSGKARNQACPCGSGKKYKKCCGKPGQEGTSATGRLPGGTYFQFHLSLRHAEPPIWRRFLMRADASFADLHHAIQLLGWTDSHLWHFLDLRQRKVIAGPPPFEADRSASTPVASEVPLATFFRKAADRCAYEYDFGDGWIHDVVLELIQDRSGDSYLRLLVDGDGHFPLEDCGGIPGHQRLLAWWQTGVDPWGGESSLEEMGWEERPKPFDLAEDKEFFDEGVKEQKGAAKAPEPIPFVRSVQSDERLELLDEAVIDNIGAILDDSLERIRKELGLHAEFKSAKSTGLNSLFTLEISTVMEDGLVMNQSAVTFLKRCEEFGLQFEDLGRSFRVGKATLRIVGLRPRAKAPVVCERLDPPAPPNQLESWTVGELKRFLD